MNENKIAASKDLDHDIDILIENLTPSNCFYDVPIGKYGAIITPQSELTADKYPRIYWSLELIGNPYLLQWHEQLTNISQIPYIKRKFINLGIHIKSKKDIKKAITDLHFAIIDIDIIRTQRGYRIVNFLGYADPEQFETKPTSEYFPELYRYKKSPTNRTIL